MMSELAALDGVAANIGGVGVGGASSLADRKRAVSLGLLVPGRSTSPTSMSSGASVVPMRGGGGGSDRPTLLKQCSMASVESSSSVRGAENEANLASLQFLVPAEYDTSLLKQIRDMNRDLWLSSGDRNRYDAFNLNQRAIASFRINTLRWRNVRTARALKVWRDAVWAMRGRPATKKERRLEERRQRDTRKTGRSELVKLASLMNMRPENDNLPSYAIARGPSWMLDPASGFCITWTLLIAACLLFILIALPLEVAYLPDHKTRDGTALGIVNRILDLLFILDIGFNFRTGYYGANEEIILDPNLCAWRYLKGWFAIDSISSLPPILDVCFFLIVAGSDPGAVRAIRAAKLLKIGRIFKVFKVLRFSHIFKYVERDGALTDMVEDYVVSQSSQLVAKIVFLVILSLTLGHLLACMLKISGPGWVHEYQNADAWNWKRQYVAALYWAFTTMSTVGYGDIVPFSDSERIFTIIAMSIGVCFYTYAVANVSSIVTTSDAKRARYFERMDAVSIWMTHHRLDKRLRRRVRTYFKTYYTAKTAIDEKAILQCLNPSLQEEISRELLRPTLLNHPFFKGLQQGVLWKILVIVNTDIVRSGECVIKQGHATSSLFVLDDGYCDCEYWNRRKERAEHGLVVDRPKKFEPNVKIMGPGSSFGEYAVLGLHPTSLVTVVTRAYCLFFRIQQDGLVNSFEGMPEVITSMKQKVKADLMSGCRIVNE